jgi:rhodanese-related sulfurtransferase
MSEDSYDLAPADAAERLRDARWQRVDVRTAPERAEGVLAEDVHIEIAELSERAGEIDRTRPALIYCRTGSRSAAAVELLRGAGYDAWNLDGGIVAWIEAGLPVASDA